MTCALHHRLPDGVGGRIVGDNVERDRLGDRIAFGDVCIVIRKGTTREDHAETLLLAAPCPLDRQGAMGL